MKKNQKIDAVCLYCEHASVSFSAEDEPTISCKYKKNAQPDGHCRRFRYDLLKRTPRAKLPIPTLDPEFVID